MKDKISIERIEQLHPICKGLFIAMIDEAETTLNITLRVTHAYRSIEQQNALYAQGRTTPGNVVTNAKGGSSYHNYGLAVDLAQLLPNGTINWNFDYSKLYPIALKYGIEWGGKFRTIVDKPHFQRTMGRTTSQLAQLPKDKNGFVIFP